MRKKCLPRIKKSVMGYVIRKAKAFLLACLTIAMNFYWCSCSREPEQVQVEKAYDFLDHLRTADVVTKSVDFVSDERTLFTINDEARLVLAQHPNSEMVFKDIFIEQHAKLQFGIGINQAAWDKPGDGVLFEIGIVDENSQNLLIFSKYIDPKNTVTDRKWFDQEVELNKFSREEVSFVFRVTGGPQGNTLNDWSGWSDARLVSEVELALTDYPISLDTTQCDLIAEFPQARIVSSSNVTTRIERSRMRVNPDYRINGEEREVILANPPSEFSYHLLIPEKAFLEVGIGVGAKSSSEEVTFEVYVNNDPIFSQHITGRKEDRRWLDSKIDLSKYGGKKVNLGFKTLTHAKDQSRTAQSMAGWSILRIAGVTPIKRNLSSPDRPNILLLVIDTQRADHLTCYGYNRDTSPTLAKFAESGVLFENAISQSSWTWPATASILTGLYPYTHGITNDENSFMVNSIVTLAEILQENHLTTFGISGNPLISKDKNFNQGFETFVEMPWARAEYLNHKFVKWLDRNKKFQFFAYLHYIDPHDPYQAPGNYYNMFDPDYKGRYDLGKGNDADSAAHRLWEAVNFGEEQIEYSERDIQHLVARYDGEIRYWDSQFALLLEELKQQEVLDKTIILITSDHGEEFLEHGKLKHGTHLYDETIKVPLIIWAPNILEGKRIEEQVETVDIYATLCKMLGIEIPKENQGRSLVPWAEANSRSLYAYSQTEHAFIFDNGRSTRNSIRTDEWKFIHTPGQDKFELYSLLNDPGERNNLFDKNAIGGELRHKLEKWVIETNKNVSQNRRGIDEETMKKLRSLGYIR